MSISTMSKSRWAACRRRWKAFRAPAVKDPDITLRADRALDYGRVMAVMGELNRAGLNRISLITNSAAPAPVNAGSSAAE